MKKMLLRVRDSDALLKTAAWCIALYVKLAYRTTRWERSGFEALARLLGEGQPVIIVCWHQRLIYAPTSWDHSKGEAATLSSSSRAGRLSAQVQSNFGIRSVKMHDRSSNLAASRSVARLLKSGVTLGVTADGPEGPPREFNGHALEWARLSGVPVVLFAYGARGHWLMDTWDRLMMPKPFTRGVLMWRHWEHEVPRKAGAEEMEALKETLARDLEALTDEADQRAALL